MSPYYFLTICPVQSDALLTKDASVEKKKKQEHNVTCINAGFTRSETVLFCCIIVQL